MLKKGEIKSLEITKTNISLVCLDSNTLRQIFLEIAWQHWQFKISLSLFDFKQLLLDNGDIVHWELWVASWASSIF
jgi:hypothetical protein